MKLREAQHSPCEITGTILAGEQLTYKEQLTKTLNSLHQISEH